MLPALVVIGLLYLAYESGALAPFGISPGTGIGGTFTGGVQSGSGGVSGGLQIQPGSSYGGGAITLAPSATPSSGSLNLGTMTQSTVSAGGSSMSSGLAALGVTGAAAGAALAGVGVAAGIFAALWSAHLKRASQAKDENSAMNAGVQGWDADIRTINQAYNAHQIDHATAIKAIQQEMYQYWQLVTPHIQPGRNGCQGGAYCPPGVAHCSGSYGAACCVGCDDLLNSANNAIAALQQGGGSSQVLVVVGSKYGGIGRPAYSLNWMQ